jgi:small-conductance mechanosensitive channel
MLEIWELFREHDIKIPIPRREIHLHSPPIRGPESAETADSPGTVAAPRPSL